MVAQCLSSSGPENSGHKQRERMTFNNITCFFGRVAYRLTLVVLLFVLASFFVRAQEHAKATDSATTSRIWFPYDSYVFSSSYMGNAQSLSKLDGAIGQADHNTVTVSIISYSSPEGRYNYNQWLSNQRANAVKKYLEKTYPFLAGRITMNPGAESWDELRANVMADTRLSQSTRTRILDIIDSNKAPDAKENALKGLSEYRRLYSNYFRGLRYADVALVVGTSAEATGTTTTDGTTEDSTAATSASSGNAVAESGSRKVVYYVVNEDEIRPAYLDNEENLLEIRRILSGPANVRNIVVVGAASPEGPEKYNEQLAQRRAESFVKLILEVCPSAEGKIEVVNIGENWDGLRDAVNENQTLSQEQKEEVLSIIDNNSTPARKEAQLRATSSWKVIRDEILPYLRYSGIASIEFDEAAATDGPADGGDLVPQVDTVATQADTTMVQIDTTLTQVDTIATQVDTTASQTDPGAHGSAVDNKPEKRYNMVAAVKTNLLYDVITALNFEIEVPIGDRFSVMVEDVFPWWETGNKYCFQYWEMGIEPRYWFKPWETIGTEKLRGFFVGPYAMSGKYDFQNDRKFNYQGEFWSAGVSGGFSMPIGRRKLATLEFSAALGYMRSDYRHYMPATDYSLLIRDPYDVGTVNYYGPTKAKISLVLPICLPWGRKEVSYE